MKEHQILFNGPMVRAILADDKTQTRRIVKPQPVASPSYGHTTAFHTDAEYSRAPGSTFAGQDIDPLRWWFADASGPRTAYTCPFGVPGDRLWVRETFCHRDPEFHPERGYWYAATEDVDNPRWTPSIHMPRRASRITLEVIAVRVERLQTISEADALAEGANPRDAAFVAQVGGDRRRDMENTARGAFACLWDSINADRASWESNPWVWVVEFRRVTP